MVQHRGVKIDRANWSRVQTGVGNPTANTKGNLYIADDGTLWIRKTAVSAWEEFVSGGSTTFIGLTDTPVAYTTSNALLATDGSPLPSTVVETGVTIGGGSNDLTFYKGTTQLTVTVDCAIDQQLSSGSAPTFTADNLSDGGSNAIITTTQESNFETAYSHSQDNTQAHSDYLINNGDDTTTGTITMAGAVISANSATITHSGSTSLTIASTSGTVIVEGVTFTGSAISGATNTNWDAAYSHISSSGTDHSYINQNVTSTGTPSFSTVSATTVYGLNFDTNVAAAGLTISNVALVADGTDTAIDITITPKGNAGIIIPNAAGAPSVTTSKLYQTGGVLYFDGVNLEASSVPGGSDTEIQFNNSSSFDGVPILKYNTSYDFLLVGDAAFTDLYKTTPTGIWITKDNGYPSLLITGSGSTALMAPGLTWTRMRGTHASMSAVQSGDRLGVFDIRGSSGVTTGTHSGAQFDWKASSLWSGSNAGTQIELKLTKDNSIIPVTRYKIEGTGVQKFLHDGTNIALTIPEGEVGIILGSATSDPTGSDGQLYYKSDTDLVRAKINGSWLTLVASDQALLSTSDVAFNSVTTAQLDNAGALDIVTTTGNIHITADNEAAISYNKSGGSYSFGILYGASPTALLACDENADVDWTPHDYTITTSGTGVISFASDIVGVGDTGPIFRLGEIVYDIDLTTSDYDTRDELYGIGIKVSDDSSNNDLMPTYLVDPRASTTWSYSSGWTAVCGDSEAGQGPFMLIPLMKPDDWSAELTFAIPNLATDEHCTIYFGACASGGMPSSYISCISYGAATDVLVNCSLLMAYEGATAQPPGTVELSAMGSGTATAGDFTLKFECINGCVRAYDPTSSTWYDYEGRFLNAVGGAHQMTNSHVFFQVSNDYTGTGFVTPTIKNFKLTYLL